MADAALTPELALDYLDELTTDIRAALVLDSSNDLVAVSKDERDRGDHMRDLVGELFASADEAAAGGRAHQVEITLAGGAVFAVRDELHTLAVVTTRSALSSLMFYDLRGVLKDLREAA